MSNRQPRVLLIDDDPSIRMVLRTALSHGGYAVMEAENGQRGFQHCQMEAVDVAILDMHMPEMSGEDTIVALQHYFPTIQIIAMSGDQQLDVAGALGIVCQFKKPFDLEILITAVKDLVRERHLRC